MEPLKIVETDIQTLLKEGRKVYAKVSFNDNPDYNWILWLGGGVALSGFKTKQDAINRAEQMRQDWKDTLTNLIN